MKKITLLTAIAMIAFTVNTFGQDLTNSADGTSTATIIQPLTIEAGEALVFGTINARVGGTLTIDPSGDASEGNEMLIENTVTRAASFNVTGAADTPFRVLSIANTVLTHSDEETEMPLEDFTTDLDSEDYGLIGGEESTTFKVGASLTVDPGQLAGDYTGEFEVTVQYL